MTLEGRLFGQRVKELIMMSMTDITTTGDVATEGR